MSDIMNQVALYFLCVITVVAILVVRKNGVNLQDENKRLRKRERTYYIQSDRTDWESDSDRLRLEAQLLDYSVGTELLLTDGLYAVKHHDGLWWIYDRGGEPDRLPGELHSEEPLSSGSTIEYGIRQHYFYGYGKLRWQMMKWPNTTA